MKIILNGIVQCGATGSVYGKTLKLLISEDDHGIESNFEIHLSIEAAVEIRNCLVATIDVMESERKIMEKR